MSENQDEPALANRMRELNERAQNLSYADDETAMTVNWGDLEPFLKWLDSPKPAAKAEPRVATPELIAKLSGALTVACVMNRDNMNTVILARAALEALGYEMEPT